MATWLYSGASVIGQSHQATAVPCQDKFKIQTSKNGEWLAFSVCDGAGSAEYAEQGASITSHFFCQELIKLSNELESRSPGEWINDFVIDCIIRVRNQIREYAKSDDIRKYHCTLVAVLIGKTGGFSIHIGDGAILGGAFEINKNTNEVNLNSNFFISKPENGEYANETFFITEGSWIKHLRITPLPKLDWIIACTDGGASLLLDNDLNVKPKFLAPFLEAQVKNKFQDQKYIENILNDPQANKITTDDKSIVVGVRAAVATAPSNLVFKIDSKITNNNNSKSTQNPNTQQVDNKSESQNQHKFEADISGKKNTAQRARTSIKLTIGLSILVFLIAILLASWTFRVEIRNILLFENNEEIKLPSRKKMEPTESKTEPANNNESHKDETTGR